MREEGTIDVDFQGQVKFGVWVSFAEIYNEQVSKMTSFCDSVPYFLTQRRCAFNVPDVDNVSLLYI